MAFFVNTRMTRLHLIFDARMVFKCLLLNLIVQASLTVAWHSTLDIWRIYGTYISLYTGTKHICEIFFF